MSALAYQPGLFNNQTSSQPLSSSLHGVSTKTESNVTTVTSSEPCETTTVTTDTVTTTCITETSTVVIPCSECPNGKKTTVMPTTVTSTITIPCTSTVTKPIHNNPPHSQGPAPVPAPVHSQGPNPAPPKSEGHPAPPKSEGHPAPPQSSSVALAPASSASSNTQPTVPMQANSAGLATGSLVAVVAIAGGMMLL